MHNGLSLVAIRNGTGPESTGCVRSMVDGMSVVLNTEGHRYLGSTETAVLHDSLGRSITLLGLSEA